MRNVDRIKTTHVGSLPRPPALLDMLRAQQRGEAVDAEAYRRLLKDSVAEVVKQQHENGIDIVSDGEFAKSSFQNYAHERLSGFGPLKTPHENPRVKSRDRRDFAEFYKEEGTTANPLTLGCVGPIEYTGNEILGSVLEDFKAATAQTPVTAGFVACVAPSNFGTGENEFYANDDEFMVAVAKALRTEYEAVVNAGFYLQIDAPVGPFELFDYTVADYRKHLEFSIEVLNDALRNIDPAKVRYHICWGSWNGPHVHDIPVGDIIDIIFKARAMGISLEAANPRHEHEFMAWDRVKLPDDKVLIPGFISHATNIVEHPELVAHRIKNFAQRVGKERVIASSDCGFAQSAFTRRVHPTIMWAKFRALREGADLASKDLWK
ncbi:MAG: cobalamin-independent methionine synthase II family protein [Dehalococcoidia bacterium]